MKIAAIIVTFNRLELLKECIMSVQNQSRRVEQIIVVNNGSSDGTNEWLNSCDNIIIINQENTGSAGGQFTGIKFAYESGFDWFWCMDDDGNPDTRCLEFLIRDLKFIGNCGAIGPTVLSKENNSEIAFNHVYNRNQLITDFQNLKNISDENGLMADRINFFNGVLISRLAVYLCGLPKKEMFIWGDELEYNARIHKSGLKVFSTINAVFYHPKDRINYQNELFFGKLMRIIYNGNSRDLYVYRNHFYILFKYHGIARFLFVLFAYLYANIKHGRIKEIPKILKYSYLGVTDDFRPIV